MTEGLEEDAQLCMLLAASKLLLLQLPLLAPEGSQQSLKVGGRPSLKLFTASAVVPSSLWLRLCRCVIECMLPPVLVLVGAARCGCSGCCGGVCCGGLHVGELGVQAAVVKAEAEDLLLAEPAEVLCCRWSCLEAEGQTSAA